MLRAIAVGLALTLAGPAVWPNRRGRAAHRALDRDTFLDLREDLETANAQGQRFVVIVEQRGCIYCTRMHEEVFVEPVSPSFR
jgi:thioredoxin-related protein